MAEAKKGRAGQILTTIAAEGDCPFHRGNCIVLLVQTEDAAMPIQIHFSNPETAFTTGAALQAAARKVIPARTIT